MLTTNLTENFLYYLGFRHPSVTSPPAPTSHWKGIELFLSFYHLEMQSMAQFKKQ